MYHTVFSGKAGGTRGNPPGNHCLHLSRRVSTVQRVGTHTRAPTRIEPAQRHLRVPRQSQSPQARTVWSPTGYPLGPHSLSRCTRYRGCARGDSRRGQPRKTVGIVKRYAERLLQYVPNFMSHLYLRLSSYKPFHQIKYLVQYFYYLLVLYPLLF